MTPILDMPKPRAWAALAVMRSKRGIVRISLGPATSLVFYKTQPIALIEREVVYYPDCLEPAGRRLVYDLAETRACQRTQVANFDFVLAQALITLTMPWTRLRAEVETR